MFWARQVGPKGAMVNQFAPHENQLDRAAPKK